MLIKRIIVLAFSYKRGARCVAGREVLQKDGQHVIGPWIRPVSSLSDGALEPLHYAMADGDVPHVMDVVEVPILGPASDPGQPENWRIDETRRWKRLGGYDAARAVRFVDQPEDIWLEAGEVGNRISLAAQARRLPQASLMLVQPEDLRMRLSMEYKDVRKQEKPRSEAVFRYRGTEYVMTVTDPIVLEMVQGSHPRVGEPAIERRLTCRDHCLMCVSLTPPFGGYHYKVIATIVGLA